ncbi:MAG: oligosaccharide flippase family protein [Clostridium sp.]|nr:oligosaccharide flippase family protein [Clostridium sp.]
MIRGHKFSEEEKELALFLSGSFIAKILSFVLFFIVIRFLTPEEVGEIELYNTNISLLLPICSLQIGEANIRFLTNDYDENKSYLTNIVFVMICQLIFLAIFIVLLPQKLLFLTVAAMIVNSFLALYARAINRNQYFRLIEIIQRVSMIVLIYGIFLYKTIGYMWVTIFSYVISDIIVAFCLKDSFKFNRQTISKKIIGEVVGYSMPLILNSLGWWLITSADRYIIQYFYTASYVGTYSVVTKVSSAVMLIMQNIYYVFQKRYIICYDRGERVSEHFSKAYFYITFFITGIGLLCPNWLLISLFGSQYKESLGLYYLFMPTIMYWSLSVFYGMGYLLKKDTKGASTTTLLSAIVNIILNCIMIKRFDIFGAIVSTTISLFLWFVIRYRKQKEILYCKLKIRYILILLSLQIFSIFRYIAY